LGERDFPGDGSSIAYNLAFGSKYDGECIEHAKSIAHESQRTTKLYDRTSD
jgi:hypothetical protein